MPGTAQAKRLPAVRSSRRPRCRPRPALTELTRARSCGGDDLPLRPGQITGIAPARYPGPAPSPGTRGLPGFLILTHRDHGPCVSYHSRPAHPALPPAPGADLPTKRRYRICRIGDVGYSDTYTSFGMPIRGSIDWLRPGALHSGKPAGAGFLSRIAGPSAWRPPANCVTAVSKGVGVIDKTALVASSHIWERPRRGRSLGERRH
jgi:hypothetical protein